MQEGPASAVALAFAIGLLAIALPIARPGDRPLGSRPPGAGAGRLLWGLPLDVNREDARTLEVLPGIGPTRAQAIVAARPFCRLADLGKVRGIGPATLKRLAGRVAVSGAPSCGH